MFCREQAVQVHRELKTIREKGAELVFVGNGNKQFAQAFKDEYKLKSPVYVDSRRATYEALGFKKNPLSLVSVGAATSAARALKAGFRQGAVQGDAFQLGGVLVVKKNGQVAYRYDSKHPGDHPPVADILAAL